MELAASMAAAAAGKNEIICKVTSWEEFWTCLHKYVELSSDETSKLVFVNEERQKVYGWLHKQSEDMIEKVAQGDQNEVKEVAENLHRFDKELTCYKKFYKEHGSDLFVIFFKMFKHEHPS